MPGALDGLLVVEVGDFFSAAYCSKLLAGPAKVTRHLSEPRA